MQHIWICGERPWIDPQRLGRYVLFDCNRDIPE
jgi:hypothetical protein